MKKTALGFILLAAAGALAVSACARNIENSANDHTSRPQQTPAVVSFATDRPHETEQTELPHTTAEIVFTNAPQIPAANESEKPVAEPSELPSQATAVPAEPTAEPVSTAKVKLDSFSFADNDIVIVDLDYDGITEYVSIVQDTDNGAMKLVIDADNKYELGINLEVESLVCAYVTDFCFGDGSAELIVSYLKPDGSYSTSIVGSFSSDTPVSCATFDGWVESLSDDGLRLCRTADVLGMRGISMLHTYNSENGSFVPLEKEWTVYSYGNYATLASELRAVRFTEEGEEEFLLEAGVNLIPTATDFYSYIDFETDTGIVGRIIAAYENAEHFTCDGVELNSLFAELPTL